MAGNDKSVRLHTGSWMPRIGLGTWQSSPGEVGRAVSTAIRAGYRHIDCAFLYLNETEVGQSIAECINSKIVARDELFIVSKLWSTNHAYDQVKPALLESMQMLQVNYLDLYLIHWPFALKSGGEYFPRDENGVLQHVDVHYRETWAALEECVNEGLIRAIGVSNFNSKQIEDIMAHSSIKPAVLQVEIHPYFSQTNLVQFCQAQGIVVTAYSPLGSEARPWLEPKPESLFQNKILQRIEMKHKKTVAQVMLRWLMERGITAVPKSCNASRIKENIDIFDFQLTATEIEDINSINQDLRLVTYGNGTTDIIHTAPYFPFNEDF